MRWLERARAGGLEREEWRGGDVREEEREKGAKRRKEKGRKGGKGERKVRFERLTWGLSGKDPQHHEAARIC